MSSTVLSSTICDPRQRFSRVFLFCSAMKIFINLDEFTLMHTAQYILNLKYKGRQLMPTNVENIEKQEYVTAVFMSRSVLNR